MDNLPQPLDNIGDRLRIEREKKGLKKTECARSLGVSPAFYGKLESGEKKVNLKHAVALRRLFACTLDDLLLGGEQAVVDEETASALTEDQSDWRLSQIHTPSDTPLPLPLKSDEPLDYTLLDHDYALEYDIHPEFTRGLTQEDINEMASTISANGNVFTPEDLVTHQREKHEARRIVESVLDLTGSSDRELLMSVLRTIAENRHLRHMTRLRRQASDGTE